MTLARLEWDDAAGEDVHLLPGQISPQFKVLLVVVDRDPVTGAVTRNPLAQHPDVSVAFSLRINGTLGNHGLAVDTGTGAVTVLPTVPATTQGHSFVLTATATQGTVQQSTRRRVHVHDALRSLWLTPSELTVRHGARGVRLTVLAEFTDGVIGDITNWSPPRAVRSSDRPFVHAMNSTTPVLQWRTENLERPDDPSPFEPNNDTGLLVPKGADGIAQVFVEGLGTLGQAVAFCAPPWSTPVDVSPVGGPGFREMNMIPNVLFLPDGFTQNERGEFEKQVRRVVTRLSKRNRTRPFGAQSFPINFTMNYFMAWVPSNDAGVSVLNELDRVGTEPDGTESARALELPSPQRPAANAATWTLSEIINEVGLPTLFGDFTTKPLDDRVQAWRVLYGSQVRRERVAGQDTRWQHRRDRVLVNEVNTAFHMAFGQRPSEETDFPEQAVRFNPRRMAEGDFEVFLDALREKPSDGFPQGRPLPKVWSTGKDSQLIVILARSLHVGGLNTTFRRVDGRTIGVSLAPGLRHRVRRNAGAQGWDLVAEPFPREPHHHVWMTTAHELGHSCGLGEEYADATGPPTHEILEDAAHRPNNQVRDALLNAAGELRADNIRWRHWPRIAKAAALLGAPRPLAPGRFSLTLTNRPRPGFARGDVARLRTRPLAQSTASGRLVVDSVTPDGLRLEIVALPGTVVDPAAFPGGSIVMVPVRAPDPRPANHVYGDDLGMVTDAVIARINLTHNPLNARPLAGESAPPNDAANRPCPGVRLPVPTAATNFPGGLRGAPRPKPWHPSWVIGLYENAAHHTCGIYRPTGICIMGTAARTIGKDHFMYQFCQVCRYTIVDALFPTAHADVEIDYHTRYGS